MAVGDRVPRPARPVHEPELAHAGLQRQEDVRLDEALPEAPHFLSRQNGHEVHPLGIEHGERAGDQLGGMPRIGVGEQQQRAGGGAIPLHQRPLLPEPPCWQIASPHQSHAGIGRADPGNDLRRRIARAIVHDDDLERRVRRRENRSQARLDVHGFVAGGNDHGEARAGGERPVVQQPGTAARGAVQDQRQHRDPGSGQQPGRHDRRGCPSIAPSASIPPTPHPKMPRPLIIVV